MDSDLHSYIELCKIHSFGTIELMYNNNEIDYLKQYYPNNTLSELRNIYNSYHTQIGSGKLRSLLKKSKKALKQSGDIATTVSSGIASGTIITEIKNIIKNDLSNLLDSKLEKFGDVIVEKFMAEINKLDDE